MGLKGLASILWLSHCLTLVFAVSRQFTGEGYLEYNIQSNAKHPAINSNADTLKLEFKTVQPSGLLFYARSSGNDQADYVVVELVGGRIRYAVRYGFRQDKDDAHEVYLGKNLDDGRAHTLTATRNKEDTTIELDKGSNQEKEEQKITTYYYKLEIDIGIFVGGATSFQNLLSVKSNAYFLGCLTNVEFEQQNKDVIKFLDKDVSVVHPSSMNKDCTAETYEPFTFSAGDSSYICPVGGLSGQNNAMGSLMFRTYHDSGTLLKQVNGDKKFELKYRVDFVELKVSVGNVETSASITYNQNEVTRMNNGNWHHVKFTISPSTVKLTVGKKSHAAAPSSFPNEFFGGEVTAGGFIGCMRQLHINNTLCKPDEKSKINKVEWNSCNITDFCVFSPCLHNGKCDQDGKSFNCECTGTAYNKPMCQFPKYDASCEILKRKFDLSDNDYTLDFDGPGPIKPASVFCNFTAEPPTTRVLTKNVGIKLISADAPGTPNSQKIEYIPSLAAAKALARHSERCTQYIEFGCRRAKLLDVGGPERLGHWVSANGMYQDYWGGAEPGTKQCACGQEGKCLDKNKKCNCDAAQDVWTSDGGELNSTTLLPVEEVVFKGVIKPGEANYTVGYLYCSGNISNTATFVNEDGFIKLKKWAPPSDGVISLYFRTPYPKGTLLYNGDPSKEYFHLEILNETTIRLFYNIGNGGRKIDMSLEQNKQVNDRSWHKVVIYHNMKHFGLELDGKKRENDNPLFLERELNLENDLHVGGYPYDVAKGFVGCIRGLVINGEVQDLSKLSKEANYVESGCGVACKNHACKHGGKCLDNYNVYSCDCSKTPFYGYFCHEDKGASFDEKDSELIYTYSEPQSVPNVDIIFGFKVNDEKQCSGEIVRLDSKDTGQHFSISLDTKLKFSYEGPGGLGSFEIDPRQGQDFCKGRHEFALSRRGKKVNYTVDGVKDDKYKYQNDRLNGLFSKVHQIRVGKKGVGGFKGCITGLKITLGKFNSKPITVDPIKAYFYDGKTDGITVEGLSKDSKAKCGPEPKVPPTPTPRAVGQRPDISTTAPTTKDPEVQAGDDNRIAIIVIVVLILVLIFVVLAIVIYWYWARHKGEYHTHEDDDDVKGTDPYIDLTAPRKPYVEETEKKKEWYI